MWQAAKRLGMVGQSVHERLVDRGYSFATRAWSPTEVAELRLLVGQCTIGEIARRLGRPYAGVALKISRLGLAGAGRGRIRPIPRGAGYDKATLRQHMKVLSRYGGKLTQYCRANGLDVDVFAQVTQRADATWWREYIRTHSSLPEKQCPYCERRFIPMSGKQQYCSRACASDGRRDRSYFGGNRRQAIGMAVGICQLCGRRDIKGLPAHHLIGKDNDPTDQLLVALCPGCHHLVGVLAGRLFVDSTSGWENLIHLVLLRRKGNEDADRYAAVLASVDIKWLTSEKLEIWREFEGDK